MISLTCEIHSSSLGRDYLINWIRNLTCLRSSWPPNFIVPHLSMSFLSNGIHTVVPPLSTTWSDQRTAWVLACPWPPRPTESIVPHLSMISQQNQLFLTLLWLSCPMESIVPQLSMTLSTCEIHSSSHDHNPSDLWNPYFLAYLCMTWPTEIIVPHLSMTSLNWNSMPSLMSRGFLRMALAILVSTLPERRQTNVIYTLKCIRQNENGEWF